MDSLDKTQLWEHLEEDCTPFREAFNLFYKPIEIFIVRMPTRLGGGPISAHWNLSDAERNRDELNRDNSTNEFMVSDVWLESLYKLEEREETWQAQ